MLMLLIDNVAIHNKNGQGLLPENVQVDEETGVTVAIHNKNGQGLLLHSNGIQISFPISRNPQ